MKLTEKINIITIGSRPPHIVKLGIATLESADQLVNNGQLERQILLIDTDQIQNSKNYDPIQNFLDDPDNALILIENSNVPLNKVTRSIKMLKNRGGHIFVGEGWQEDQLELPLKLAFEKLSFLRQKKEISDILTDQNSNLKVINENLEHTVKDRQKSLKKSQEALKRQEQQAKTLQKSLMAIHQAKTFSELEQLLNHHLSENLSLEFVKIDLGISSNFSENIPTKEKTQYFSSPIEGDLGEIGRVFFKVQSPKKKFAESEKNLMTQVTEGASLALRRLSAIRELEVSKEQWQSTFDAIQTPLCLVDSNYSILKANLSYSSVTKKTFQDIIRKHGLRLFFDNDYDEQMETKLKAQRVVRETSRGGKTYRVNSHPLKGSEAEKNNMLLIFRDISEEIQVERQILESSKMTEMGLIGSSIAHELNNPLGGVLAFSQLALMKLGSSNKHYGDLKIIEESALRCSQIVQDLLGFTRKSNPAETRTQSPIEIVNQAIAIVEIRSRSRGVKIQVNGSDEVNQIKGHYPGFDQACINILQNSVESIFERQKSDPRYQGLIEVELKNTDESLEIQFKDNGMGIDPKNLKKIFKPLYTTREDLGKQGLGLTMVQKIVSELKGRVEISSQTGVGTVITISLKRPENGA